MKFCRKRPKTPVEGEKATKINMRNETWPEL